ncbi:MAG TPA: cation transporter [Nitrosopumilaceae archaeon]|jgi:hypothetical protein|nr:cation transporter [Nitrosopumilaceae archaeon]
MKKLATIVLIFMSVLCVGQEKKKETNTVSFKVYGVCEQCKRRIENAADIKGVKFAEWDENTGMLKVTFRVDKVSEAQIKEAILKSGHDVEDQKAPEAAYKKLPDCCKYREINKK